MGKEKIAIACQGGGSQTAFTAGVLSAFFGDEVHRKKQIVSLSGTSGGAVCASLAWYGPLREQYFHRTIGELGHEAEFGRSIHLLLAPTKDEYFAKFNQLLHETDVLWTKPSELCFYPALGIPLIMSEPLGAHEERNLETVLRVGAGQRQEDPRAAAEWLTDWLNNGLLALNAFQGYFHMPRMGTENIKRLLFAPDRSQVAMDLEAVLPERA